MRKRLFVMTYISVYQFILLFLYFKHKAKVVWSTQATDFHIFISILGYARGFFYYVL